MNNDELVPRFDLRKLTSAANVSSMKAAEQAYREWHMKHGINRGHNRLKKKYTGG